MMCFKRFVNQLHPNIGGNMRNILWSSRRDVERASRNHRAWLGLCDTRRLDSCDRPRTRVIAHARFPLNRDRTAWRPIVSCAPMRRGRAPGSLFVLEGRRRPPPFLAARARRLAQPLRTQGQGHSGPGLLLGLRLCSVSSLLGTASTTHIRPMARSGAYISHVT